MSLLSSSPSFVSLLPFKTNFLVAPSVPGTRNCSQRVPKTVKDLRKEQRFLKESHFLLLRPKVKIFNFRRKNLCDSASWLSNSQIANEVFTLGSAAVLPFYALMVLAPNSNLTKRSMDSNIPYVLLGSLYSFLLYLSWTPDSMRLMFASKYWFPELSGIPNMFKNEMSLASAWIHLLAVDLFAARQVFHDGQKHDIETRHSISLCLLFCPIHIMTHALTKALSKRNCSQK